MLDVRSTARSIEEIIGYVFTNKLLCAEAVQMASPQTAASYDAFHRLENNRRLSTLGHLTLKNFLCLAWYRAQNNRGNALSKAEWTTLDTELLSNDALAKRGSDNGIHSYVYVADGTSTVTPKMVATALQAIVAAVFQDGGDEAVMRVMKHLGFMHHRLFMIPSRAASESYGRPRIELS